MVGGHTAGRRDSWMSHLGRGLCLCCLPVSTNRTFFLVLHFNFLFVPCGRLSWLPVSFLLHVKHTLSYRIVRWLYVRTVLLVNDTGLWWEVAVHTQCDQSPYKAIGSGECISISNSQSVTSVITFACHVLFSFPFFSVFFSQYIYVGWCIL